ncbi:MAG: iron-containing alcohol dehydrogenase [bacterium]|nr:iron-containing alcohol dehydrogenase [bacterium]
MEFSEFQVPTRVVAGRGLSTSIDIELQREGLTRGLLLTDAGVRPLADRVRRAAGSRVVGVYDAITPNSSVEQVEEAARLARELEADFLLAVGGGSVLDTAKAAALVFTEGGRLLDHQGVNVLARPLLPVAAVPTTAGTGSEVSIYAVVRDENTGTKVSFISEHLAPALAVLDPVLTLGLPPGLTAATGLDALTHALEAFLSVKAGPLSDALALAAARTVLRELPRAVVDGSNLEARWRMLTASCLAGMAFSWAMVGCVHAMAHACGGLREVPHGLANAILLPHGLEYNRPAAGDRFGILGEWMGADPVEAVRSLAERIALPTRLREVGVEEADLAALAELAMLDGSIYANPREATAEEIEAVLRAAL